jgi:hypothetical protein
MLKSFSFALKAQVFVVGQMNLSRQFFEER